MKHWERKPSTTHLVCGTQEAQCSGVFPSSLSPREEAALTLHGLMSVCVWGGSIRLVPILPFEGLLILDILGESQTKGSSNVNGRCMLIGLEEINEESNAGRPSYLSWIPDTGV